jgi:Arc/MetJ-type ribon-helix-helix transcriptional regulator
MNIPANIENAIRDRVASGRYASEEDVLCRALAALEEIEHIEDDARAKIEIGLRQLDNGEGIPMEDVFHSLRKRNFRGLF